MSLVDLMRFTKGYWYRQVEKRRAIHLQHIPIDQHATILRKNRGSTIHATSQDRPRFIFNPDTFDWNIFASTDLLKQADHIINHTFNILGSGTVSLPKDIPWHTDFKSGYTWPARSHQEILFNAPEGVDIKVPWELSRLQHFITLGIAYRLTGDERYAQEFLLEWDSWHAQNPWGFGVNWKIAMEVAIRACNIIAAWYLFQPSILLNRKFKHGLLASLHHHGEFIFHHQEKYPWGNTNHYIADLVGLLFIGTIFPEFPESYRWQTHAIQSLEREIRQQVCEDGVDFEHSISYHRLVTEFFAMSGILCQANNIVLSDEYWQRLEKMFFFVDAYIMPTGQAPQIGDNDDGRLFIVERFMGWDRQNHRALLDMGRILFPDPTKPKNMFCPEASLLTHAVHTRGRRRDALDAKRSSSFPLGGFYFMKSDTWYCCVRAGSLGQNGNGGHDHNDVGGFVLNVDEQNFIIDPGTYVYTPEPSLRNLFRSSKRHSVPTIDDTDIFTLSSELFSLLPTATVTVPLWKSNPEKDELHVRHSGFERLPDPVSALRSFHFEKVKPTLRLTDSFQGQADHDLTWRFILDPGVNWWEKGNGLVVLFSKSTRVNFTFPPTLTVAFEPITISPSYGVLASSHALVIRTKLPPGRHTFTFSFSHE